MKRKHKVIPLLWRAALLAAPLLLGTAGCDPEEREGCSPGTEGCGCMENRCLGELMCLSDACVDGSEVSGDEGGEECNPNEPLAITGGFNTEVATVKFDRVDVDVFHKRDIDEFEDRCINEIRLQFNAGSGCKLTLVAGGYLTTQARLAIRELHFAADSQCPSFPDEAEGIYTLGPDGLIEDGTGIEGFLQVPDRNSSQSCFNTDFTVHLAGPIYGGGEILMVNPTRIEVIGSYLSNSYDESCPEFEPG